MELCFFRFSLPPPPKLHFVPLPVSLADARYRFVSTHVPWPSVSAATARSLKTNRHIVVPLIRSDHTLRWGGGGGGWLCISALWLLEKLFNYWEILRRGITATRKRFLRMIGFTELVPSLGSLMLLFVWSLMFHAFTAALVSALILQGVLKCDFGWG